VPTSDDVAVTDVANPTLRLTLIPSLDKPSEIKLLIKKFPEQYNQPNEPNLLSLIANLLAALNSPVMPFKEAALLESQRDETRECCSSRPVLKDFCPMFSQLPQIPAIFSPDPPIPTHFMSINRPSGAGIAS
jgi:hypothetical protein